MAPLCVIYDPEGRTRKGPGTGHPCLDALDFSRRPAVHGVSVVAMGTWVSYTEPGAGSEAPCMRQRSV